MGGKGACYYLPPEGGDLLSLYCGYNIPPPTTCPQLPTSSPWPWHWQAWTPAHINLLWPRLTAFVCVVACALAEWFFSSMPSPVGLNLGPVILLSIPTIFYACYWAGVFLSVCGGDSIFSEALVVTCLLPAIAFYY